METFNLADAVKRPVVQLDEHTYYVKAMTRETWKMLAGRADPGEATADDLDAEKVDELAYRIVDELDVMLDPDGDDTPRAGSVLRRKWDADEVSLEALTALAQFVGDRGNPDPPA